MNEVPVLFYKKSDCCGCSVCYAICPVGAIQMIEDEKGFCYPRIDNKKCIKCWNCLEACPIKVNNKVLTNGKY